MLNTLRSQAGSLFAKLLLALLVVSFGIWGVADMLRYGGAGPLATVGGQEISQVTFERALRQQREALREQMGKNYNPAVLRAAHLELRVMEDLITSKLLRMETKSLGIIPPDSAVVDAMRDDKGNFDKEAFKQQVHHSGMGERAFVDNIRQQLAVQMLVKSLNTGVPTDKVMQRTLYGVEKEVRTADVAKFSLSLVKSVPEPSEDDIKKFYDEHKAAFATPEFRIVHTLSISKDDLLKTVNMPESKMDEAVVAYTNKLEDLLAGGDTIKEAGESLKAHYTVSKPFDHQGKGLSGEEVDTPEAAATVFGYNDGAETALKLGKDGMYAMQRTDVAMPAAPLPLEKVHDPIAAAWKKQETFGKLATMASEIAKEMKESKEPLAVLAKHGLTTETVADISKTSKGKLPQALVQDIFLTPLGSATGIYPSEEGFYIAVVKARRSTVDTSADALKNDTQFSMYTIDVDHAARDEVLDEFLTYLRSKYRVTVNAPAIAAYAEAQQE